MSAPNATRPAYPDDDQSWLRLHIGAVWGVSMPPLSPGMGDVRLEPEGTPPPWALYLGELTANGGRIHIWRSDVTPGERARLLGRGAGALATTPAPTPGARCEVALRPMAAPRITLDAARQIARRLNRDDPAECALLMALEATSHHYADEEAIRAAVATEYDPLIGVVVEGRLLALAHSSRRTAQACELGINTLPEARRQGYALAATVAWAQLVADEGLAPIYSAFAENTASLALANAAGYRPFVRAAQIAL